jgi:hypothetical protein
MGEVGVRQLSDVLPQMTDRFSPLFLGDHVVALCVPESFDFLSSAGRARYCLWVCDVRAPDMDGMFLEAPGTLACVLLRLPR